MAYPYITDNNLQKKQHYMYSEYHGLAFLKEYLVSRAGDTLQTDDLPEEDAKNGRYSNPVREELWTLYYKLKNGKWDQKMRDRFHAYIKSFEVRKRLYTEYEATWKPAKEAGFEDFESYLIFADCLILVYQQTNCLKYFSCLLKLNDTLLSVQNRLQRRQVEQLQRIVKEEVNLFNQLLDAIGIVREEVICK